MRTTWRKFAKRQQSIEKEFVPKMAKAIRMGLSHVINHLKSKGAIGIQTTVEHSFIAKPIHDVLVNLYKISALSEAAISFRTLRNPIAKRATLGVNEAWNEVVDTYLLRHNAFNTVEKINETTKKMVLQIISHGLQNGDSVPEIIEALENEGISLKRAQLIVRTESVGAMNIGSMLGAISTGIIYQKRWVTAGDHRVRGTKPADQFSHVELNGDVIDMEKPFNNGEKIWFPGDKRGSAGNFCNCRCCMSYIAKRDENGRIMRYGTDDPTMFIGPDGKLIDILMQVIAATIFSTELINSDDIYPSDSSIGS